MHNKIANGVIHVISECGKIDPDQITKETAIKDVLDSLSSVETIIQLEQHFQLVPEISSRTAYDWNTVGDVIEYLRTRLEVTDVNQQSRI